MLRRAKLVQATKIRVISTYRPLCFRSIHGSTTEYIRPTTYFESTIDQTKWHFSHAQRLSYRLKLGGWEANNRQTRELACRSARRINVIGIGNRKSGRYAKRLFRAGPRGDAQIEMDCINTVSSRNHSISHSANSSIL